jgi:hypothetical protein
MPSDTSPDNALLLRALRDPSAALGWSAREWSTLVQQARACGLLGRVAQRVGTACRAAGLAPAAGADGHFMSSMRVQRAQQAEILREAGFLRTALASLEAPVVVLKGAAYVLAGLPAAEGRLFSDIDIMVPKACINRAESLLLQSGWLGTHDNAYDQRYYREWMHELPPMEHVHRHTVLDVHHTLLPETSRLKPDAAALFVDAIPLPDHPGLLVLSPPDMVLHSITHLFMNDELSHALRDLSDIDALLRHFGSDTDFWGRLVQRARQHQLARLLHHGLRYTQRLFATPVPVGLMTAVPGAVPGAALQALLDVLWLRAFNADGDTDGIANAVLYLRGHWLRMPPLLLARHLSIKALGLHKSTPPPLPGQGTG